MVRLLVLLALLFCGCSSPTAPVVYKYPPNGRPILIWHEKGDTPGIAYADSVIREEIDSSRERGE